jgi:hypothetical protein
MPLGNWTKSTARRIPTSDGAVEWNVCYERGYLPKIMALNGKENNMVRGPLNSRVKKIDFEIVFSELLSQKYQEFVSNP